MTNKKELHIGSIFTIPLFLPLYKEWTHLEDLIDYRKYRFREDDVYAYGRLIDIDLGNCSLIEIFQYVGAIPDSPAVITDAGRMFEPVFMVHAFGKNRWRFLFDNPQYDKWKDCGRT